MSELKFYTKKEVAKIFHTSEKTVQRWVEAGEIKGYRTAGLGNERSPIVFSYEQILNFAESRRIKHFLSNLSDFADEENKKWLEQAKQVFAETNNVETLTFETLANLTDKSVEDILNLIKKQNLKAYKFDDAIFIAIDISDKQYPTSAHFFEIETLTNDEIYNAYLLSEDFIELFNLIADEKEVNSKRNDETQSSSSPEMIK